MPTLRPLSAALLLLAPALATAQSSKPTQVVKPPVAQAWLDLATHHSDMPGIAQMMGGGMPSLGSLFGKKGDQTRGNVFGQTQSMGFSAAGQYLDVSVHTRANPSLSEALQAVPPASQLSPTLQLIAPQPVAEKPPEPVRDDDEPSEPKYEKPKGKLLLYWGCGEKVRPGQPRVLDFANLNLEDVQRIMVARGHTPKGARSQPGVPAWPNKQDDRKVPAGASLNGEHGFTGQGIPEGFKFELRPEVDFMAPLKPQRNPGADGAMQVRWEQLPHARAFFISAMGAKPGAGQDDGAEMVLWSSSELPDTGFALHDYQTPGGITQLLKDKVLLQPSTTECAIPGGIFGQGAEGGAGMLRMSAYGPEQSVAYPPRPTDPKQAWEPQWAARVRTKSTYMGLLGVQMPTPAEQPAPEEPKKPKVKDLLKGLLGR